MIIKNRKIQSRGFTIVEVIIALFVAALVISGYVGANLIIQKNSQEAFERTVAVQDAYRVIEQMRTASQTGSFPTNVTTAFPQNGLVTGFTSLPEEQVLVHYDNPTDDLLYVLITVSWESNTEKTLTASLRTLIGQR